MKTKALLVLFGICLGGVLVSLWVSPAWLSLLLALSGPVSAVSVVALSIWAAFYFSAHSIENLDLQYYSKPQNIRRILRRTRSLYWAIFVLFVVSGVSLFLLSQRSAFKELVIETWVDEYRSEVVRLFTTGSYFLFFLQAVGIWLMFQYSARISENKLAVQEEIVREKKRIELLARWDEEAERKPFIETEEMRGYRTVLGADPGENDPETQKLKQAAQELAEAGQAHPLVRTEDMEDYYQLDQLDKKAPAAKSKPRTQKS